MKRIPRTSTIYSFSPKHRPVETVALGEVVVFETLDALGGQVKDIFGTGKQQSRMANSITPFLLQLKATSMEHMTHLKYKLFFILIQHGGGNNLRINGKL